MSKVLFPFMSKDPNASQWIIGCIKCGNTKFQITAFNNNLFADCTKCHDSVTFDVLLSMYEQSKNLKRQKNGDVK